MAKPHFCPHQKTRHVHSNDELDPGAQLTPAEVEFAEAMDAFMRKRHIRFPHWSDVLHVVRSLGYAQASRGEL